MSKEKAKYWAFCDVKFVVWKDEIFTIQNFKHRLCIIFIRCVIIISCKNIYTSILVYKKNLKFS